ncbi:MAG: PAS domain-containing sensor histidine kinase [Epsilonproteobacteria bacterium]|nr:PAS domain-containing sensor histidine kinase [Campylobacterota bacterium]
MLLTHNYTNLFIIAFEIIMIIISSILLYHISIDHESTNILLDGFIVFLVLFIFSNLFFIYYLHKKDKELTIKQLLSEKKLSEENHRSNAIFNLQKAMIIVRDGIEMTKANDAFFKTLNFTTLEEFASKHVCISELFISKEKHIPHLQQMIGELTWLEYVEQNPDIVHEVYMLDKHNREHIFVVEIHENVYSNRTMVVFTDITEIKHQYETFHRLFETSPDGLLIMKNRRYIDANDTLVKLLKYNNKEEILALNPLALMPPFKKGGVNSKKAYKAMMKQCQEEGFSSIQGIHIKTTGEEFWCDIAMTRIKIHNEDAIHIRWRDIDEYKKLQFSLEEEVQQQAKALISRSRLAGIGEMMENITHQWKQPLSIILNLVTLMKLENREDKNLLMIEEQTKYLNQTIDDFRFFSNSSKEETSYFDLKESITNVFKIFKFQALTHNITLDLNIQKTAYIKGDIGQFNQAILVILSNAKDAILEHTSTKRWIHIYTSESNNHIMLTISDNGGGIPLDIIDKIFEPYFTTKFKDKGTGIGLSMTYNIIEKYNGHIKVNNTKMGAKLIITLPKYQIKDNDENQTNTNR